MESIISICELVNQFGKRRLRTDRAAMTQRPDLFGAVVCTYPLLDMVRYHQFLVARFWIPEYGSADDPDQFEYIHAYSPYHNVE